MGKFWNIPQAERLVEVGLVIYLPSLSWPRNGPTARPSMLKIPSANYIIIEKMTMQHMEFEIVEVSTISLSICRLSSLCVHF